MLGVIVCGLALGAGILAEWSGAPSLLGVAFYALSILAGALTIVPAGIRGVFRERSLDINFLVTVAVLGAIALGQWSEGATVVFLFSLGEWLEEVTLARTRHSIQALMAIAPETARVRTPQGAERTVRVEDVAIGSVVLVRPGDRVPLDGLVTAGESTIDQAPITGESLPVDKTVGETVYAGTVNGRGYLEVRTTKPFAENTLSKIIHLVEEAQSEKAPSQRFVERFARVYTPLVVVGAVLLTILPPLLLNEPFIPWFNRALVLLLVACPCALVISTPVTVVAAIGNASRHGVLIKGGAYLERAGTLRAVAFDKTGTLTRGVPAVREVVPLNGMPPGELLALAAAVEARSEHPLGEAIVRAARLSRAAGRPETWGRDADATEARRDGLPIQQAVERFGAVVGSGVQAMVDGKAIAIGKPGWVTELGVRLDADSAGETLERFSAAGHTSVVVAADGAVLGVIAIADELRSTAAATVAALRATGVRRIVMVTGDNTVTAQAIARQAGIPPEDVLAELLPEGKVAAVRHLQAQHGGTAMVGDGVNDAPALAAATVGIAMGAGGSDTALETADVALVADDLTRLPWVLQLSRSAARTIRFNVAFALLTKLIVLVLAAFGYANLWLAIAADTGASVLVILNGMRLLGRMPLPKAADPEALRRRFGLDEEETHAGHAHAGHAH